MAGAYSLNHPWQLSGVMWFPCHTNEGRLPGVIQSAGATGCSERSPSRLHHPPVPCPISKQVLFLQIRSPRAPPTRVPLFGRSSRDPSMASSRVLSPRLWSRLSALLHAAAPVTRHSPPPDPRLRLIRPFPIPPPSASPAALFLRHLSTVPRRHPSRFHTVDIGARARQLQNRRLWTYALTFSCVAGFIVIVLSNFQDQLVFYITPSDAMQKFAANPSKNRFRLGGLVLEGSVVQPTPTSSEIEFVITDLVTDILVRFEGSLPDLFREGHSAVVEGFLRPLDDSGRSAPVGSVVSEKARSGGCFFKATEVLAKHDEKYMPKEVAEAIERNKKQIKADLKAEAAEKTS
ncbi:hypothetical protein BHM03_00017895 [Ensete ventricosum]|nr:hypothetical protein BHM03_00017895 [Ensete ventricosum]